MSKREVLKSEVEKKYIVCKFARWKYDGSNNAQILEIQVLKSEFQAQIYIYRLPKSHRSI